MTVFLVGAGPGLRDLVTLRAAELLGQADVVVVDRLVGDEVLAMINPAARVVDVGKHPATAGHGGDTSTHQDAINAILIDEGRSAAIVVRLKGGDPFLFGRGGEEAEALAAAGIAFEVVPGVSSAFALPALAGIPVTHRGVSRAVVVVSGHEPVEAATVDWAGLATSNATLVVLMGVGRRGDIAHELIAGGRTPQTPVVAIERGGSVHERRVVTTLADLGDEAVSSPAVIVIGAVAAFDFRDATNRPLLGVRVALTRPVTTTASLAERLRSLGATLVQVPVIETVSLGAAERLRTAILGVPRANVLALTSARAVPEVLAAVPDRRELAQLRVAAVGAATAHALAGAGLVADIVADGSGGEALARAIGSPGVGGERAVVAHAAGGRLELATVLEAAGWDVDVVPCYETRRRLLSASEAEALIACEIVVVASPSAVDGISTLRGASGELHVPRAVVAIGETTAAAARSLQSPCNVVAPSPDDEGLVAGVLQAAEHLGPVA